MWDTEMVSTNRGAFEIFIAGTGQPICVTHYYSAFTKRGNYFADRFTEFGRVILVNLKECGNTDRVADDRELSMYESVLDLEAIRMSFGYDRWSYAGHSTGGMLGLVYGIHFAGSYLQRQ